MVILFLLLPLLYGLEYNEAIYDQITEKEGGCKVYELSAIEQKLKRGDIMVIVKGKGQQDPNILISQSANEDCSRNKAEYICDNFGIDICTIPQRNIEEGKKFWISVECNKDCEYELRAVYSQEQKMKMNDELLMDFENYDDGSEYSRIVKIKTSNDISQYENMKIVVQFLNWYDFMEGFNVYLSESPQTPSSQQHDRIGEDVFIGVKIIELHTSDLFKPDTEYELLVEAPSDAQLLITTYTYGEILKFDLYEYVDDTLEDNQSKNYILQLDDEIDSDIQISLFAFSGNPDLYINIGEQPLLLDQYMYSSVEQGSDSILVRKEDIKSSSIYILVLSQSAAAYTLFSQDTENFPSQLQYNVPISATLQQNEHNLHEFFIDGSEPQGFVIMADDIVGHTQVFIKKCEDLDECEFTKKELAGQGEIGNDYIYDKSEGKKAMKMLFDPEQATKDEFEDEEYYFSLYQIYIMGMSEGDNKYTLTLTFPDKSIQLQENYIHENWVETDQVRNFYFEIPKKDQSVTKVQFYYENIQGQAYLLTSRDNNKPTLESSEGDTFTEDLQGVYYLSVIGITDTLFTITPVVTRLDSENQHIPNYIKLKSGTNDFSVKDSETLYFKMVPHQQENSVLNINFQSINGDNTLYLLEECVLDTQYEDILVQWETTGGNLQIEDYNSYYCLMVVSQTQGKYKINYNLDNQLISLKLNDPYYGSLDEDEQMQFKILVQNTDLQITRFSYSHNDTLVAYISYHQNNTTPNATHNDYVISKNWQSFSITIELLVVSQCPFLLEQDTTQNCYIYVSLVSSIDENYFSLLVGNPDAAYLLFDSVPVVVTGSDVKLYYYISHNDPIEIYQHNFYDEVTLYANIIPFSPDTPKSDWQYPTSLSYQYKSLEQYQSVASSSITIDKEAQKNCEQQQCLLLIRAIKEDKNNYDFDDISFTIYASMNIQPMQLFLPTLISLKENQVKFYSFSNPDENANIFISFTSLSMWGVEFYVSKGKDLRPSPDNYDWSNQDDLSNSIDWWKSISSSKEIQIIKGSHYQVENSTEGQYVLGIYASQPSQVQVQILVGEFKYFRTYGTLPIETSLNEGEQAYFEYAIAEPEQIKILISRLVGDFKITLFTTKKENIFNDLEQRDKSHEQMVISSTNSDYFIIDKTNKIYCTQCTLIVKVAAINYVEFSLAILDDELPLTIMNNQVIKNYVMKDNLNSYVYYGAKPFKFFIKVIFGQVKLYTQRNNEEISKHTYQNQYSITTDKVITYEEDTNEDENTYFYSQSFLIEGLEDSMYQIQIVGSNYQFSLSMGQPEQFYLTPGESISYRVFADQQGLDSTLFQLMINLKNDNIYKMTHQQYLEIRPKVTISREYDKDKFIFAEIKSEQYIKDYILYDISDQAGVYQITIENNHKEALKKRIDFSGFVLPNNNRLQLLAPNQTFVTETYLGVIQSFEMYIDQPQQVLIETTECTGSVSLFATYDYQNLINGVSELEHEFINNKQETLLIKVKEPQTRLYIGVKSLSGDYRQGSKSAAYMIKATLLNLHTDLPVDKFQPGNQGNVFREAGRKQLKLSIAPVIITGGLNDFKIESIQYLITVEKNKLLCQSELDVKPLRLNSYDKGEHDKLEKIEFTLKEEVENGQMLEVFALVKIKNNQKFEMTMPIYYDEFEVFGIRQERTLIVRLLRLIVPLIFMGSMVFAIFIYKRNKELKRRLRYEMEDVRNIASSGQEQQRDIELNFREMNDDQPQQN